MHARKHARDSINFLLMEYHDFLTFFTPRGIKSVKKFYRCSHSCTELFLRKLIPTLSYFYSNLILLSSSHIVSRLHSSFFVHSSPVSHSLFSPTRFVPGMDQNFLK